MSVLSYLNDLSSRLVISQEEKMTIAVSISFMRNNLLAWEHHNDIKEQFVFGSYDRETILPRWADADSDVDYMVVFNNPNNLQPQTFLTWLRSFADKYYSRSVCRQSFPTVAVELSHIKFELVPSVKPWGYLIRDSSTYYSRWQTTDPNALKQRVATANAFNRNVRPLIRIMKYWNASHGKPYASFELEQMIAYYLFYGQNNLEECFYLFVDSLPVRYEFSQVKKNAINNLKYKANTIRERKRAGNYTFAENLVKSIFE